MAYEEDYRNGCKSILDNLGYNERLQLHPLLDSCQVWNTFDMRWTS